MHEVDPAELENRPVWHVIHDVLVWLDEDWYVPATHKEHEESPLESQLESQLTPLESRYSPAPQAV